MIRRLLASQGRQATAAHAAAAAAAEAAGTLASPLLAVGRRRGIHTWYSISTSGVTRVRMMVCVRFIGLQTVYTGFIDRQTTP